MKVCSIVNDKFKDKNTDIHQKSNANKGNLSFQSILNNITEANNELQKKITYSKDALEALNELEKLLKIKITKDDFNKEGNLEILEILNKNSKEITKKDIKYVRDNVRKLWNTGVISLEQCKKAIQWLSLHYKAEELKDKYKDDVINLVGNDHLKTKK